MGPIMLAAANDRPDANRRIHIMVVFVSRLARLYAQQTLLII